MSNFPNSLCRSCQHVRMTENKRGSTFFLCRMSEKDPRFGKYPPQPVGRCLGFEKVNPGD